MKAVIINRYGSPDVLQYTDIELPQIKSDELLVKIRASSVNPVDWKIRKGIVPLIGKKFPMILGMDLAGDVVQVGDNVTGFQVGDGVYADIGRLPGGAYGEYAAVSAKAVALKPGNISYEEAAVVPIAGLTALQCLRDFGQIKQGQKILINGASGGVGTFAVQIAKAWETEVTAVCSGKNIELVKTLGADRVIDYTQEDFTQDSEQYDIILDAVANQSLSKCADILHPQGIYITTYPTPRNLWETFMTIFTSGKKSKFIFLVKSSGEDLAYLNSLIECGKIRSVIDRTYHISDIAAAHRYSEEGHVVGKIAIAL